MKLHLQEPEAPTRLRSWQRFLRQPESALAATIVLDLGSVAASRVPHPSRA